MRSLIFITLLVFLFKGVNSKSGESLSFDKTTTAKGDTDFILKEKIKGADYVVFIEKNRKSEYYNWLTDFSMDKFESQEYKANLKTLKKNSPEKMKKYTLHGLPKEWIPLYLYKGKYYIYYPMEAGELGRRIITDSTMIYWFNDGKYPLRLQSVKQTGKTNWQFRIKSPHLDSYKKSVWIIIHIIDPINQIAVWENSGEQGLYRYDLYIPKSKAKNFDVVVSKYAEGKLEEFNFDPVDYKALLKKNSQK
jgi:hypothetical protein